MNETEENIFENIFDGYLIYLEIGNVKKHEYFTGYRGFQGSLVKMVAADLEIAEKHRYHA